MGMAKLGNESGTVKHAKCSGLGGVDDDRLVSATVAYERDDAVRAGIGVPHPTVVAADADRRHATIMNGG